MPSWHTVPAVASRALRSAVVLAFSFAATPAAAIEGQHHLGLAPTLSILKVDSKSTASVGGGGALHYTYGLTDAWNFTAEASSAIVARNQGQDNPGSPRDRPATVSQLSVGTTYVIDILQWVPYIGLQGGVYQLTGGTLPDPLFIAGAAVSVGIDYQLSRSFAVGIGGRQHFLLSRMATYPSYTTVGLRVEFMWGY